MKKLNTITSEEDVKFFREAIKNEIKKYNDCFSFLNIFLIVCCAQCTTSLIFS